MQGYSSLHLLLAWFVGIVRKVIIKMSNQGLNILVPVVAQKNSTQGQVGEWVEQ